MNLNIFWNKVLSFVCGKEASCGKKVNYKSKTSAEKAATKLTQKWQRPMDYYNCYWCKGWHIGNKIKMSHWFSFKRNPVEKKEKHYPEIHTAPSGTQFVYPVDVVLNERVNEELKKSSKLIEECLDTLKGQKRT